MPGLVHRLLLAAACVLCASSTASAAGLLLPRGGSPLSLKHHRVEIEARDGTTVTTVDQVFVNEGPRQLEATYLFPLPAGAVLSDFKLQVGGVMKRGEVLAKEEAERIYLNIVRSMKDPGLVDWMGDNLFRARIFPVPARGEQRISLTYTEVTPRTGDTYRIVHPLRLPEATSRVLQDFTVTVRLRHRVPLRTIYSPSHRISVRRRGDHEATVGFESERVALDRDFVLHVGISDEDMGVSVLPHRDTDEPGYFTLLASPRYAFEVDKLPRKAITFVLDTSGSMQGDKLKRARQALRWSLDQLGSSDRFNVIRFASDVESYRPGLVPATRSHREAAKAFVAGFDSAGGTAIDVALKTALDVSTGERDLPHIVVFITDGRPTVGETVPKRILERTEAANRGGARVFVLGIGEDVETQLLDGLAEAHGGAASYVRGDTKLAEHIAGLYTKLAHPVLTDIRLEISGVRPFAVTPSRLPTLFKGDQLVITGRYREHGDALIRLSGAMNGARRTWDYEATFPKQTRDNSFVAPLWANRQVGVLLDQVRRSGETRALKAEIVQLATRFGIVTPYTSYLVTEGDDALRATERRVPMGGRDSRARAPAAPALDGDLRDEAESTLKEAFRLHGGSTGAGTGGGGSGTASPKAASGFGKARSGARAVDEARALRHMKNKKQAKSDVATVRYVGGRVMRLHHGGWSDGRARSRRSAVKVAPYSKAWLAIRKMRPDLAPILALGERVTVSLGDTDLVVEPGAASSLTAAARRALRR